VLHVRVVIHPTLSDEVLALLKERSSVRNLVVLEI